MNRITYVVCNMYMYYIQYIKYLVRNPHTRECQKSTEYWGIDFLDFHLLFFIESYTILENTRKG